MTMMTTSKCNELYEYKGKQYYGNTAGWCM